MTLIRPAAVAGLFYSDDAVLLHKDIDGFIKKAREIKNQQGDLEKPTTPTKAIIAPHAGYKYSGLCATMAYLSIEQERRDNIKNVILLGPAHRHPANGMALSGADYWESPFGAMPINTAFAKKIAHLPQTEVNDRVHMQEHCLEVHVPFIQKFFRNASLIPFAVTGLAAKSVAEVLEMLWGGDETLIVISSDLSQYHPYCDAMNIGKKTANNIENFQESNISGIHACGHVPLSGLLLLAKNKKMHISRLYMTNSGEAVEGAELAKENNSKVVGYGAWRLH